MDLFRAGVWHDLIYDDEDTSKFWSIKILKNTHIRKWGALGTMGQEKVTHFNSSDEARDDAEQMYIAKTRKGYKVCKPKLPVSTELVHTINSIADLNNFFFKVYGVPFNMREDWAGVSNQTLMFTPDGTLDKNDVQAIDDWVDSLGTYPPFMTHRLLDDCVRQRLIPAGTYLIDV